MEGILSVLLFAGATMFFMVAVAVGAKLKKAAGVLLVGGYLLLAALCCTVALWRNHVLSTSGYSMPAMGRTVMWGVVLGLIMSVLIGWLARRRVPHIPPP